MHMRTATAVLIVAFCVGLCSCAKHTQPIVPAPQMSAEEARFETAWTSVQDVLRRYNFELNRVDRRDGVITTEPLVGRQWFEFWRKDAATRYDCLESSLQTIYRQATVCVDRAGQPSVEVRTYRSDRQAPQITNTSEAYGLFAISGEGRSRAKLLPNYGRDEDPQARMVALGRDADLEGRLSADIAKTIARAGR